MKPLKKMILFFFAPLFVFTQTGLISTAFGCACGCGIFDVGTSLLLPSGSGGMVYFEYDFINQNKNWHATHSAPGQDNSDKIVRTNYTTLGSQYFFNRSYGLQVDLPVVSRHFETADPDSGTIGSFNHTALGDIRVKGIYTGFSEDLSTGLTFGLKLPTGPTMTPNFDFDTQIGTGTTDFLIGIYHLTTLSENHLWTGFYQLNLDQPFLSQNNYIAGNELDAVYGIYYRGLTQSLDSHFVPMLQVKGTVKGADSGANGHPDDTGYTRLMIAPALEFGVSSIKIYTDLAIPFYQNFSGNQLVSNYLFKSLLAYYF